VDAAEQRVLLTDTTMRDAHQSLLRHPHAHPRHAGDRAALRAPAAGAVLAGMLGRRDLRRRAALPQGRPVGAPGAAARSRAQHAVPDAAARLQRGRLHQLSRQRRALLRAAGGEGGRRRLPRLRLAQLGGQHARRDGRRARDRRALRGAICYTGDLFDPGAAEVQPEVLRRHGQAAGEGRRPHPRHQGHGRRLPPRAARELVKALKQETACRSTSTPTTPAASPPPACWRPSRPACDAVDGALDA
jgi:hypothetical protein